MTDRPMRWCDACAYGTNDPSELMRGRDDTVWCPKRLCGGQMTETPPPRTPLAVVDSSAAPDVETVRLVERDPNDPGMVRIGATTVDHRANVAAQTVDLLKNLLAAAERGEIQEVVGVGYSGAGIPEFFCSHRDHGRASGALAAAQHVVMQRWLDPS